SFSVTSARGAPNDARPHMTRVAFSGVASIQTSRSPVARGRPCTARAYAPTMRNRTSAATNARNRSTKTWFIGQLTRQPVLLFAESPDEEDALGVGQTAPEIEVVAIGVGSTLVAPNREPFRSIALAHVSLATGRTLHQISD